VNARVQGGDLPGLTELLKRMEYEHASVLVGVPAGKVEQDGTSIAMVAAVNEFGSPERNIPERPVLRQGGRRAMREMGKPNELLMHSVIDGKRTLEQAVDLMGVMAVGIIKREFTDPQPAFEPNKPATIARKKSTRPLIDSGQYHQSITHTTEAGLGAGAEVTDL
jgi:hypothetical protein